MPDILLRPTLPEKDFGEIALLISSQEDVTTSGEALREDYETHKQAVVGMMSAVDEHGDLLGFYWAWHNQADPNLVSFHLVVKPEHRQLGAGTRLFTHMQQAVTDAQARKLRFSMPVSCPEGRAFAERRDFREIRHDIGMELDLEAFDDRPYDAILRRLQDEGFEFTSMQALGDTEEARRKLYALNDAASASTPGQGGEHAWASFEDFQKNVCQSEWYQPAGQIVAIDTTSGDWAGMSAITRMQGREYAYNLFTGVDLRHRGRKLGQAVKVLALRYARNSLQVKIVRTHHNTSNLPMIAIDTKFGYRLLPDSYLIMEKELT